MGGAKSELHAWFASKETAQTLYKCVVRRSVCQQKWVFRMTYSAAKEREPDL